MKPRYTLNVRTASVFEEGPSTRGFKDTSFDRNGADEFETSNFAFCLASLSRVAFAVDRGRRRRERGRRKRREKEGGWRETEKMEVCKRG